jgi:hypothetical protein
MFFMFPFLQFGGFLLGARAHVFRRRLFAFQISINELLCPVEILFPCFGDCVILFVTPFAKRAWVRGSARPTSDDSESAKTFEGIGDIEMAFL